MPSLKLECNIEGFEEFESNLNKLGTKIAATVIARAVRAGGEILAEAQRDGAPEKTDDVPGGDSLPPGAVKNDIQVELELDGAKKVAKARVGPGVETGYVVRWLEEGHEMVSHGKKRNRKFVGKGFVAAVNDGAGFMAPAFEASAQAALDRTLEVIAEGIDEGLDTASSGENEL